MAHHWLRAAAIAASACLLAATARAEDTIRIGMFGPLSGPAARSGIAFRQGWDYVVQQVNAAGGIAIEGKPRKIELLVEDSQSKPDVGLSAAQKLLTRDDVDILVGDMIHSDVTLAVMDFAASFPKVMYTGEPTSLAIAQKIAADPEKFANTWKWDFSSDAYAATTHDTIMYLVEQGAVKPVHKTIAVVGEDSGFSRPIVDALKPLLAKDGWSIAATELVPVGTSDFYTQIDKIRAKAPDFILSIFTAANSAIALTKQMREQGVKAPHLGLNGPLLPGFIKGAGPAAEGTLFAPQIFDPVHNARDKVFAEKLGAYVHGPVSADHVNGYCNAEVLMDVLRRANSLDVKKLDDAFAHTDYRCLIARFVFRPDNHQPRYGADFFAVPSGQIQGGEYYAIWPQSVATAKYRPAQ